MKIDNIALLVMAHQAGVHGLSQLSGTIVFDSTMGCSRCIRSGYRFCASRYIWNQNIAYDSTTAGTRNQYQPAASTATNEALWDAQLCCNPATIDSSQNSKCLATNILRKAGVPSVDDYICSSDFSSLDKAIISCPQLASKKTSATQTAAQTEKCGLVDW